MPRPFTSSRFLLIGALACTVLSTRGKLFDRWTTNQLSTNTFQLRCVAYGNGVFVAAGSIYGDGGVILSSTDGQSWQLRAYAGPNGSNPDAVWALTFGNGRFVGVGHFGGTVTSTNGTNWTFGRAGDMDVTGVAYYSGTFYAVGHPFLGSGIAFSTDGVNWTTATNVAAGSSYFTDVASLSASQGPLYALGQGGRVYRRFSNHQWVPLTGTPSGLYGGTISFANGISVVPSSYPGTNYLDWVNLVPTGLTNSLGKISTVNGYYLAPCGNSVAVSQDLTNWFLRPVSFCPRNDFLISFRETTKFITDGKYVITSSGQQGSNYFVFNSFIYRSPLVDLTAIPGALSLSGITGRTYRVEFLTELPQGTNVWQTLTNITLTNTSVLITNSSSDPQRFYRGVLLP
jgi:hypothetical protein